MNHIYRSVWNEISRTYVAAAEIVRGKGKDSKSSRSAEGSEADLEAGSNLAGATGEQGPPARPAGLRFGGFRSMALEQRFMFDGAAVGEAVDTLYAPVTEAHAVAEAPHTPLLVLDAMDNLVPPTWTQAQEQAAARVQDFLAQTDQRTLFAMFNGGQDSPDARWQATAESLLSQIRDGDYSLQVQLRSAHELHGAMAAFAAQGPDGQPIIYLNAEWACSVTDTQALTQVLIEEVGHSLDARLNGSADTQGDEGESFAIRVLGLAVDKSQTERLINEQDRDVLQIDGQTVVVENAAVTFAGVYTGTPSAWSEEAQSLNSLTVVSGSNFKFTSLTPGDPYFSGNNVAGTLSYLDADGISRQMNGVISRLFKTGSTVEGFYFYAYGNTVTIGDGGSGGDTAEKAYLLVRQGFTSSFAAGTNEGTSSDPVDSALNTVLTSNSAPTANNDLGTVTEDGSLTGNLLTNDTDPNFDTLTVTQFAIDTNGDGVKETFTVTAGGSSTATITGVGILQVSSNGSYTFTPAGNYSGAVPAATYTISDGRGGTASASLSLSITPVNDPPTSSNDIFNVSANTKTALSLTDFGNYADTEGSPLASIEITTLPATGKLEYFNGSSWVAVTAGDRISASAISAGYLRYTGGSDSLTFKVSDGTDWSSNAYTLTIAATVVANQAPDAINDSNIVTKSVSLMASGNVLTNDRDPDGVDSALTVSRASTGSSLSGSIVSISSSPVDFAAESATYTTLVVTFQSNNKPADGNTVTINGTGIPTNTTGVVTMGTGASSNVGTIVLSNSLGLALSASQTISISATSMQSMASRTIDSVSGVSKDYISVSNAASGLSSGLSVSGTGITAGTTITSVTDLSTYRLVKLSTAYTGASPATDLQYTPPASQTITGTYGTLTLYQNGSYSYTANSGAADGSVDTFTYEAKDANGGLDTATLTITVRAGNTAPVNDLPTSLLVDTGGQLPISTLTVSDINNNLSSVALSVTQGTLSASTLGAGSASGKGTTSLTLSGTQADINAMLATLVYTANTNASGTDTLSVVSTDGSLSDTDNYAITLRAAPTVTGTTVNEASPYVYFTVSGAINQSVSLASSGAPSNGTATIGSDVLPNLEYYDGSTWRSYTGAVNIPSINSSGKLFVRAAVLQDSVSEGAETLRLTATNVAGVSNTGDSTIRDDGAGNIYDGTISDGNLNTTGGTLDDDRPFGVNNIFVNEGSPFAVFEVTGVAGQTVSLALQEGTAKNSNVDPDFGSVLQYLNSSNQWTTYTGAISIPTGGKLLVRTAIVNNSVYEGAENFGLVATNTGGVSTTGTAVILDDGTGAYYPDNTTGTTNPTATLDRDTAITVTAQSPVNEASPFTVFTVVATSGLDIGLLLNNGTAELNLGSASIDYSYDGVNWTAYTWDGSNGNKPTAPAHASGKGTFYVRVGITSEQDSSTRVYEGPETFELIATTLSISGSGTVTQSGSAEATIVDDGTGWIDGPNLADHTTTGRESDLPSVSIAVSPSSMLEDAAGNLTYTVTLSHASAFDTVVTYSLSGTATEGNDYGSITTKSLTIAAGNLSGSFSVDPTADETTESDETVIATVTGATTDGKALSVTTSTSTGTITNDDTTNNNPVFEQASGYTGSFANGAYTFSYNENQTLTTTVIGKVAAADADGDTLTYSITTNVNVGTVETPVDAYAINSTTGEITLTTAGLAALTNNYEALANAHQITVSVTDGSAPATTVTVNLNETNLDDNNPVFEQASGYTGSFANGAYTFSYNENQTLTTTVIGKVAAADADGDTLTYSITTNVNVGTVETPVDAYAINSTTGEITLTTAGLAALTNNYEALANAHQITVSVTDGSAPATTVTVNLNETNLDDNNPVFEQASGYTGSFANGAYTFSYNENQTLTTTVIGKVAAADADGDTLTYSITTNVNVGTVETPVDAYAINSTTGEITLTTAGLAALTNNYEALANAHQITVSVTDGSAPATTVTVNLNETNLDDNNPVFEQASGYTGSFANGAYTFSYNENQTLTTTVIGKVAAADADGDTLTYSITTNVNVGTVETPVDAYAINSTTGEITLTTAGLAALTNNYEALANAHQITVSVTDGSAPATTVTVNLNETNLDDNNPVFEQASGYTGSFANGAYTFSYNENQTLTTTVIGKVAAADADGDTLTYSITTNVNVGTVETPVDAYAINSTTGEITLTTAGLAALTNNYEALANAHQITVSVTDGSAPATTVTVNLNETNLDDNNPVFEQASGYTGSFANGAYTFSYNENQTLTTTVIGKVAAADADGDTLTYSITTNVNVGTVETPVDAYAINSTTGEITLTTAGLAALTNNYEALANAHQITVSVTDGSAPATTVTVNLNETNLDDNNPVFEQASGYTGSFANGAYTFSYNENQTLTTTVIGKVAAADADGDTLTYSITTNVNVGTVETPVDAYAINSTTGEITLTTAGLAALTNNYEALANAHQITVSVTDGSAPATTVTVNLNETNLDDNNPVFEQASGYTGSFANGAYTFSYNENQTLTTTVIGKVAAADADGDTLTYSITTNVNVGTVETPVDAYAINSTTGEITLTTAGLAALTNNYEALANAHQITVSVTDGSAPATTVTVNLNETNLDDNNPVFEQASGYTGSFANGAYTFSYNENQTLTTTVIGKVAAADADGDTLTYSITTNVNVGTVETPVDAYAINSTTGEITLTTAGLAALTNNYEALANAHQITVSVTDGSAPATTVTVNLNETNLDDNNPVFEQASGYTGSFANGAYTFSYNENQTLTTTVIGKVAAADADGDTLTYSITTNVNVGTVETPVDAYAINSTTGEITLTTAGLAALTNNYEALANAHQITVSVTDGSAPATTVTVNLNETNLDDNNPVFEQASGYTGSFANGAYTFSYNENQTLTTTVIGKVAAADADGDTLTYSITTNVNVGTVETPVDAYAINSTTGEITLTTAGLAALTNNYEALANAHQITVSVTDGSAPATTVTVNLNETNLDDNNPVFEQASGYTGSFANGAYTFSYNENQTLTTTVIGKVAAADADGDTLTYSITTNVNVGTVETPVDAYAINSTTGEITLTTAGLAALTNNYEALANAHQITVSVTDGSAPATTVTVNLNEVNVNDNSPTTSAVTLTAIAEDSGSRVITQAELLGNAVDLENNTLVASAMTSTSGSGTLVDNGDGTWTYTPELNDDTAVSFRYTITDNGTTNGVSDPKTVTGTATLDITPVNDAPIAVADTATTPEDTPVTIDVLANDSDVDGPSLNIKSASVPPDQGTVAIVNGKLVFTPAKDFNGTATITYVASDGSLDTAPTPVTVIVTPVFDPVTVSNPTVNEASPYVVFTVTGGTGESVTLNLSAGSATGAGVDFGASGSTQLKISTDGGRSWAPYSAAVTFPADGKLLARTPVKQDTVYEGAETLTLKATPAGGAAAAGTATIVDDGTGTIFNTDGSEDSATRKDDDRPISIAPVTVNEATPYAVFRVEASGGQQFALSLRDGPSHSDSLVSTATTGADYRNSLETYDGVKWIPYTPDTLITVPNGGSVLLVRVPIMNDSEYEDAHAFTLIATIPGAVPVTGNGIIGDYGTGAIFNDSGAEDRLAPKDDDRGIRVDSPIVNEGSEFVVFTIKGSPGPIGLRMPVSYETDEPIATGVDKSQANIQFWDGLVWQTYNGSNASIPAGGTLLVRVGIAGEQDNVREGSEHFALVVTRGGVDSVGEASVRDDGTGVIYQFASDAAFSGTTTIGVDDDFDKDGITPTTEEALATLAASQGIGNAKSGDINGDGKQDAEQNALATLAWTVKDYFIQGNEGTLTESKAIISVSVTDGAGSKAVSTTSQLLDIVVATYDEVDQDTEVVVETDGSRTVTLADGSQATTPWDPIRFAVEGMDADNDGLPDLSDIDLTRSGTQVRILVDIRASGLTTEDVNGYIKYVSQEAIDSLGTLVDLDGRAITRAGWYDFTQRQEGGDGARFIDETGDGKIDYIELIITDNAFGDNDATLGKIFDPGTPVRVHDPVPAAPAVEVKPAAELPAAGPIQFGAVPRFEYSPFDSTLYALTASANPMTLGLIERTSWSWADQDRDWAQDPQSETTAADLLWTTLVVPSEVASLQVFRGMGDQFAEGGAQGSFTVPADAFVHTQSGVEVVLTAKLADGSALPRWIRFDARSGKFSFEPSENFNGELRIKLTARDSQGREAVTLFRFHVGDKQVTAAGRAGLSQQLREAAQHKLGKRAAPAH